MNRKVYLIFPPVVPGRGWCYYKYSPRFGHSCTDANPGKPQKWEEMKPAGLSLQRDLGALALLAQDWKS